ncbi:MAG: GlpM family protein [bacterium]|nr:GlpM family protein [bacterium]
MTQILIKAVIGGAFIGLILWLSQTKLSYLAGLLLFFPIISLPTFFFLGSNGNGDRMRETIIWSFWAIPVWIAFASTLYWCSYRFKILPSILLSLLVWLVCATILVFVKKGF